MFLMIHHQFRLRVATVSVLEINSLPSFVLCRIFFLLDSNHPSMSKTEPPNFFHSIYHAFFIPRCKLQPSRLILCNLINDTHLMSKMEVQTNSIIQLYILITAPKVQSKYLRIYQYFFRKEIIVILGFAFFPAYMPFFSPNLLACLLSQHTLLYLVPSLVPSSRSYQ